MPKEGRRAALEGYAQLFAQRSRLLQGEGASPLRGSAKGFRESIRFHTLAGFARTEAASAQGPPGPKSSEDQGVAVDHRFISVAIFEVVLPHWDKLSCTIDPTKTPKNSSVADPTDPCNASRRTRQGRPGGQDCVDELVWLVVCSSQESCAR